MKTNYLLPSHYKKIGWFLFIPGVILGISHLAFQPYFSFLYLPVLAFVRQSVLGEPIFFTIVENNIFDEIIGLLLIIGALFIAFTKEKSEDEFISKIRLESLLWATYVNYLILIFAFIFIYEMAFYWVLVFNLFTILIVFIIRFNWALKKSKKLLKDEE